MTTAVTNTPTTSSTSNNTDINNGLNSLASNYQTFLSLLTTQLKNQDPLSPLDTNQFTQQLTQMTGVEQQLLSNQLLQQLVTANQSSGLNDAVSLIGKSATASGSSATLTSGSASWPYTLSTPAASGTVSVVNSGGTVVWTGPLTATNAGSSTFNWNGKDSTGTQQANGGTYTLKISATDASGAPVTVTNGVNGLVTAAQQVNGVTMVTINGVQVPLSTVTGVNSASAGG
ncbi:MAG TPA: flagellar hook capping FlgD N-terminal domain-containing protein [Caulobacteraceae bacterium]|jgi:flagellar basal-body rod modification protein FlgD